MIWFKKLGYKSNPFSIKPTAKYKLYFDNKDVLKEVKENIDKGNNILIKGVFGTGKTTILKHIIKQWGGKRKIYYYNAFSKTELEYDEILKNAGNIISRIFKLKSKDVIIFVDEAHKVPISQAFSYREFNDKIKSLVFISSDTSFIIPKEFENDFPVIINLDNFTQSDALNIVKDRLGVDQDIIPEDVQIDLYRKSYTPRDFIISCEAYCRNNII